MGTDLLVFNAGNHPYYPSFPYAFVQLREVAARFGLSVAAVDLLAVDQTHRTGLVRSTVERYRPRMIGVTLRNTDSHVVDDYQDFLEPPDPQEADDSEQLSHDPGIWIPGSRSPYFPVQETGELLRTLRRISTAPLVVGGYGFSALAAPLLERFDADYGVQGAPDAYFAHFEDICRGNNLSTVPNLLFWEGDTVRANRVEHFAPSPNREYCDEVVADWYRFSAGQTGSTPLTRAVPLEVMRGCPHRCSFCSEPAVKGTTLRYRSQEVVCDEIEFLGRHDLSSFWFICSEINAGGNDWVLELAEQIIRINERRQGHNRAVWYSYHLPTLSLAELRHLRRAGFLGGWTNLVPLDEQVLARLGMPYDRPRLVAQLRALSALRQDEEGDRRHGWEQQAFAGQRHLDELQVADRCHSRSWCLFLGVPAATPASIRTTLQTIDQERFNRQFFHCYVQPATRIFATGAEEDPHQALSCTAEGPVSVGDYTNPTFAYPAALLRHLGSPRAVRKFFAYAAATFLSRQHLLHKRWDWFLRSNSSVASFHQLLVQALQLERDTDWQALTGITEVARFLAHLTGNPETDRTGLLFNPPPGRERLLNHAAGVALGFVLQAHWQQLEPVGEILRLPGDRQEFGRLSEYGVAQTLYSLVCSRQDLLDLLDEAPDLPAGPLPRLFTEHLLYRNNIVLKPEYRVFFIAE